MCSSEHKKEGGGSGDSVRELHLFEKWLSRRGAPVDDKWWWLRLEMKKKLLFETFWHHKRRAEQNTAGQKTETELITLLVDKHFINQMVFFADYKGYF